jgi:hypothetical protein
MGIACGCVPYRVAYHLRHAVRVPQGYKQDIVPEDAFALHPAAQLYTLARIILAELPTVMGPI